MNQIKYFHLRNKEVPTGGITIAMQMNEEDKAIAYALAMCHPNDNYNKHTGRAKATGRLLSPRYRHNCEQPLALNEVINEVIYTQVY